mmetsp:Transcript_62568/g.174419  ORF Transcript_62568/g.174419 Transcript_62568/m.174419 type:complete len:500 (+) Transcript_62568:225-1724(+)
MAGEELGGELRNVRWLDDETVRRSGRIGQAAVVHAIGRARNHRMLRKVRRGAREGVCAAGAADDQERLRGLVVGANDRLEARGLLVGRADANLGRDFEFGELLFDCLEVWHIRVRARHDCHKPTSDHPMLLQVHHNPLRRLHLRGEIELLASDLLVNLDVPVSTLYHLVVSKLRRGLVFHWIETHLQKGVAHVLLREFLHFQLWLRLEHVRHCFVGAGRHLCRDLGVLALPLLDSAKPRGVRRIDLVDDVQHPLLVKAKLVLGVDENQSLPAHQLRPALVQLQCNVLCLLRNVFAQQGLHLLHRHVLIVPHLRLCGRCEKRGVELLEAIQPVRHGQAAKRAVTLFVGRRHAAPKVPTHDQLDVQVLHLLLHDDAAVHVLHERIRHDVAGLLEGPFANHIQDLPLEGDKVRQDVVEGGDTVVRDHDHIVPREIDIAHLPFFLLAELGNITLRQGQMQVLPNFGLHGGLACHVDLLRGHSHRCGCAAGKEACCCSAAQVEL